MQCKNICNARKIEYDVESEARLSKIQRRPYSAIHYLTIMIKSTKIIKQIVEQNTFDMKNKWLIFSLQ